MRILELLRPTNLTYFGLAVIGLGIAVIKIFPVWYPGLAPLVFGIAILIFDLWCKQQILKYGIRKL